MVNREHTLVYIFILPLVLLVSDNHRPSHNKGANIAISQNMQSRNHVLNPQRPNRSLRSDIQAQNEVPRWARLFKPSEDLEGFSIDATEDGGYIVSGRERSYSTFGGRLIKLSPTGAIQWQRAYDYGEGMRLYSVVQISDGGYIISGRFFSAPTSKIFIMPMHFTQVNTICSIYGYGRLPENNHGI